MCRAVKREAPEPSDTARVSHGALRDIVLASFDGATKGYSAPEVVARVANPEFSPKQIMSALGKLVGRKVLRRSGDKRRYRYRRP